MRLLQTQILAAFVRKFNKDRMTDVIVAWLLSAAARGRRLVNCHLTADVEISGGWGQLEGQLPLAATRRPSPAPIDDDTSNATDQFSMVERKS